MFRYEVHLHSSGCSACGASTAKELVKAAKERDYAGVVFTNHFYHGNTAIPRELPWKEFVEAYRQDWLEAREYGVQLDVDVLFGLEEVYESGKEVLIYGIAPELIAGAPEFRDMDIGAMSDFVRRSGGFLACAHPFRVRDYIPEPDREPDPLLFDAVEGFNRGNALSEMDEKAVQYARKYHLPCLSGGDVHHVDQFGYSGLAFSERIRSNEQLVKALRAGKYELIVNGEIRLKQK